MGVKRALVVDGPDVHPAAGTRADVGKYTYLALQNDIVEMLAVRLHVNTNMTFASLVVEGRVEALCFLSVPGGASWFCDLDGSCALDVEN